MGAPTSADPVVIDFGTSAAAEGKVRAQFQKKQAVPRRLADRPQRHADDATPACCTPSRAATFCRSAGTQAYKGFGLGLLLDLLCGGLSGGPCSNPAFPLPGVGNAAVFVLFDPAQFGGTDHFLKETDGLTAYVRSCPTARRSRGDHAPRRPRADREGHSDSSRVSRFRTEPGNFDREDRRPN